MANLLLDVTSANAEVIMNIDTLYPAGVKVEQFTSDTAISVDTTDTADVRIGVDGNLVGGWIASIIPITINLEATSPTYEAFANLFNAMQTNKRIYQCTLVISYPSISRRFTLSRGLLRTTQALPAMEQILSAVPFTFNFGKIDQETY